MMVSGILHMMLDSLQIFSQDNGITQGADLLRDVYIIVLDSLQIFSQDNGITQGADLLRDVHIIVSLGKQ